MWLFSTACLKTHIILFSLQGQIKLMFYKEIQICYYAVCKNYDSKGVLTNITFWTKFKHLGLLETVIYRLIHKLKTKFICICGFFFPCILNSICKCNKVLAELNKIELSFSKHYHMWRFPGSSPTSLVS